MDTQANDVSRGQFTRPLQNAKKLSTPSSTSSLEAYISTAYALCLPTLRCCETGKFHAIVATSENNAEWSEIAIETAFLQEASLGNALHSFDTSPDDDHARESRPDVAAGEQSNASESSTAIVFPGVPKDALHTIQDGRYRIVVSIHEINGSKADLAATATTHDSEVELSQIVKLLDRLDHVLGQLAEVESTALLSGLSLCSPEELERIMQWNSDSLPEATGCAHDLFAEQLPKRLDEQAVEAWDFSFTYRELDILTSRLTSKLIQLGVGPESMVPFCFEKSGLTVIALLAILRAGGACIPLDPAAPPSRLLQIIEQTGAKIALTSVSNSDVLTGMIPDILTISLELLEELAVEEASPALSSAAPSQASQSPTNGKLHRALPDNTAFVLFTSGSTGQPKGITLTHRALATSMRAHAKAWDIGPSTRIFSFSAYTFDASIADIFTTIGHGGCVCIPSDEARMSRLAESIRDMRANWCFLTPTVASTLQPSDIPSMRTLAIGGEQVSRQLVATWARHLRLIVTYGLTECSIYSTGTTSLGPESPGNNAGHPFGCRFWLCAPENPESLVGVGCEGEILIEGTTLAKGYLNDPTKTAKSFLNCRVGRQQGLLVDRRVFKTGDLGYLGEDGSINIVGRKDTQVKLRGLRIELGDVEHHLRQASSKVLDVVVDQVRYPDDKPTLVAYVSCSSELWETQGESEEQQTTKLPLKILDMSSTLHYLLSEIDQYLRHHLQAYMVPTMYMPINFLPLTAGGKKDRKRLEGLAKNLSPGQRSTYTLSSLTKTKPETPLEHELQALWATALGLPIESIGREDNFFRLGGDSLRAMKLVALAQRTSQLSFGVQHVFQPPILSDLATYINASERTSTGDQNNRIIDNFSLLQNSSKSEQFRSKICADAAIQCHDLTSSMVEDVFPCTPLQEGLVALSMKRPGSYTAQYVFNIPHAGSIDRFKNAWHSLVQRAPILRCRIVNLAGYGALQVQTKEGLDWRTFEDLDMYLDFDSKEPMAFGTPLAQFALSTSPGETNDGSQAVITLHHALYDGVSLHLMLQFLADAYDGQRTLTELHPLSPFISHLQDADHHIRQDRYWQNQLQGFKSAPFPDITATGNVHTREEAVYRLLATHDHAAIGDLTVSTLIRAAWSIVIAKHSNNDDVVFGATLSGRSAPVRHIANIVGPTICTVPVRSQIRAEESVRDYLLSVQNQAIEMMAYEHAGLQRIKHLGPDAAAATAFQTLLVVQPEGMADWAEPLRAAGIDTVLPRGDGDLHDYPLVVECVLGERGVEIVARYDATLLSTEMVNLLTHHLQEAIASIIRNIDKKVGDVSLFGSHDQDLLLSWNDSPPTMSETCIHDLITKQVSVRPQALAVDGWDINFTYAELDRVTSVLASLLLDQGIHQDSIVPFLFEKSSWAIVAQLATLKAGGACVALNPNQPLARLREIVRQANAAVVLCSEETSPLASNISNTCITVNRDLFSETSKSTVVWKRPQVSPHDLAYIVFTSGSTGQPKGIMLEHRALTTSMREHQKMLQLSSNTRTLQFGTYIFDVSIAEIMSTLAYGGCVCVPTDNQRLQDLTGVIQQYRISHMLITSTTATLITRPEDVPTLQVLCLSGEPVRQDLVHKWAASLRMLNFYGPAETSIWCTGTVVAPNGSCTNIGTGMGARIWIIDDGDDRRLSAIDCVGEILIEGPIARGYVGNDALSKARFIDGTSICPLELREGGPYHMYMSGDLAKYNLDGTITVVGRRDTQIKLRGQRIELSEIEFGLRKVLPSNIDVAVDTLSVAQDDQDAGDADVCIVAFYASLDQPPTLPDGTPIVRVMEEPQQELLAEAYQKLGDLLPPHMLPSYYFPLTSIPRSTSGKCDHRRLKELSKAIPTVQLGTYTVERKLGEAPRTEVEITLQKLWHGSLNVGKLQISRDDHYFRLGGDSLSAIRMSMSAREQGLQLNVSDIFRNPRLADMASKLCLIRHDSLTDLRLPGSDEYSSTANIALAATSCGVAVDDIEAMYPCTALQEGMFALSIQHEGSYTAQIVLKIPADINFDRFTSSCLVAFERHSVLRTRIVDLGRMGLAQAIVRTKISAQHVKDKQSYLRADHNARFGQPLCQLALTGSEVIITAHHALYDGWSWGLIYEDIAKAYQGVLEPVDLESEPKFEDFVRQTLNSAPSISSAFWAEKLAHANTAFFPAQPGIGYKLKVDAHLSKTVSITANRSQEVTLPTIVQAAWALTSSVYSCSDSVTFGILLSGRNAPVAGIGNITGPTIAAVPYQTAVDHSSILADFLRTIETWNVDVVEHEHVGLQAIKRINAEAAAACDFSCQLVIHPTDDNANPLQSLGVVIEDASEQGFATFPLTVESTLLGSAVRSKATFDSKLVPVEQVGRILAFYHTILKRMTAATGQSSLAELCVLSDSDHEEITSWQKEHKQLSDCLDQAFTRQVQRTPQALAVRSWDGELNYQELDRLSTALARHLVTLGIGRETIVLLCFEKSLWAVVSMIAVLKAGAACTSVDFNIPDDRLRAIVSTATARFVLTDNKHKARFEQLHVHATCVDAEYVNSLSEQNGSIEPAKTAPSDLAFLVFTSGSTGVPKGIMLEHQSICTASQGHAQILDIKAGAVCLQFSAYAYDVHISDIFTTLMYGGTIAIPSEFERHNDLAAAMRRLEVNRAYFTPTVANLLRPNEVPALSHMVVGGESLHNDLVRTWQPHVQLFNAYGPSETSNWVCAHAVSSGGGNSSTIGKPQNCSGWIVDPDNVNRLLPVGSDVGELIVSGPTLARGYIGNSSKTAAAFVPAPAWYRGSPQYERFYKTGDLVKYDARGTLLYVGRKDTQVKVHGQRLELAEVESCFNEVEDISAAIVTLPKAGPCKGRLVAVIAFNGEEDAGSGLQPLEGFREQLAQNRLPDIQEHARLRFAAWMIPAVWIFVHSIPRSPTGKLNRRAVQDYVAQLKEENLSDIVKRKDSATEIIVPHTSLQQKLQAIWSEVLNLPAEDISINESFTRLGGDSISAIQVVSRGRTQGLTFNVQDILLSKTIEALCPKIKTTTAFTAATGGRFPLLPPTSYENAILDKTLLRLESVSGLDDIEDVYPCSPLQEGILLSQIKDAELYKVENYFKLACRAGEEIDLHRLSEAWETLVQRHPILRTVFITSLSSDNSFWQVVLHKTRPDVEVVTNHTGVESALEVLKHIKPAEYSQQKPFHRLTICLVNDGSVDCRLDINHTLVDGFTTQLMFQELTEIYGGRSTITDAPRYASVIAHLLTTPKQQANAFWSNYLQGAKPCVFPALNDGCETSNGSSTAIISFGDVQSTLDKCKELGVTLANVLQLAWALTLQTYINEDDVLFGCLVSGRDLPVTDIQNLLGPVANMIVCRSQLDSAMTVEASLEQVRDNFLRSLDFQTTPLATVQHVLGQEGSALFNTSISIQRVFEASSTAAEENLVLENLHDEDPTEFDLSLVVDYSESVLNGRLVFDTRLINLSFGRVIVDTFEQIFSSVLSSPQATIGELSRLGPLNRERILSVTTPKAVKIEECIHSVFEEQVRRNPAAIAIESWDGTFTYAELDKISTRLARNLVAAGVKTEDIVPLCFDKSRWVVVAQLAVLKAGGAVLTLDMSHPSERLEVMVQASHASIVLGSSDRIHTFGWLAESKRQTMIVDQDTLDTITDCSTIALPQTQPSSLAFIVFTSGSTGLPKGIMLNHHSVRTASAEHKMMFGVGPESRCFQFSAFAFDVHITDIFVPLQYGATLLIPNDSERMDDLAGAIRRSRATDVYITPTVASLFAPEDVPTIRNVLLGGEPMSKHIAMKWTSGDVFVVNAFGPSETANWVSYIPVKPDTTQPLNVGSGKGLSTWLVNPTTAQDLVPIGAVGEMYVESPSLARGYLNDTKKTDASFFMDPSFLPPTGESGRRVYATGDLVRNNSNGSMVYVGRKDNQVKIHGQRLEPAEVEIVLTEASEVRYAFVSRPKEGLCADQTTAVVVLQDSHCPTAAPLNILSGADRHYANKVLPSIIEMAYGRLAAWMMPTVWVLVNHIPLSPSGKLDRNFVKSWLAKMTPEAKALVDSFGESDVIAPRNDVEAKIHRAWSHVLNIPEAQLSVDKSFNRLGGDSISAIQVTSRCRTMERLEFTVKDMIECKTIAALALRATKIVQKTSAVSHRRVVNEDEEAMTFELTPIQKMFYAGTAQPENHYNQCFLLETRRQLTVTELSSAVSVLVEHHTMLRCRLVADSSVHGWVQQISSFDKEQTNLSIHEHHVDTTQEIEIALSQAQRQFDVTQHPLYAVHLIQLGESRQMVFITVHHLVIDLVSWRILLHDLETILETGQLLAPKTLSFRQWSIEQNNYIVENVVDPLKALPFTIPDADLAFWQMQDSSNRSGDAVSKEFRLNTDTTARLFGQSMSSLDAEPLDILLASLILSFHQTFPERQAPAIFNESHGRELWADDIDISRTIGWFTAMYPIHSAHITGEVDARDAVSHMRQTRQSIPRNGWDYFSLRYSGSEKAAVAYSGHENIEIVFNYAGIYQQLEREKALFTRVPPASVNMHEVNPDMPQQGLFSIGGGVENGRLFFDFSYNKDIAHQQRVEHWISRWEEILTGLAGDGIA